MATRNAIVVNNLPSMIEKMVVITSKRITGTKILNVRRAIAIVWEDIPTEGEINLKILIGAEWKSISEMKIVVNSQWKDISEEYILSDGAWKR